VCPNIASNVNVPRVKAVQFARKLVGGSQPRVFLCSDGREYVVKFQNNPQGRRILVNELLGTLLARELGLPVAEFAIVEVSRELASDLWISHPNYSEPCLPGLCFGSHIVNSRFAITHGTPWAKLGSWCKWYLCELGNFRDFVGMWVFDRWTCNADDRQVMFVRGGLGAPDTAVMIDFGMCFGGQRWKCKDHPWAGLFGDKSVYSWIQGIQDFDRWLIPLERGLNIERLVCIQQAIPPEWYGYDYGAFDLLLDQLDQRRLAVGRLLLRTRVKIPDTFPKWDYTFNHQLLPKPALSASPLRKFAIGEP
jgi:hypothetical protein